MRIIVTGGAGFIGTHFCHYVCRNFPEHQLTVIDALTYAGCQDNLRELIDSGQLQFVRADINQDEFWKEHLPHSDLVINFAAESHVDNSIQSSKPFMESNVMGVHCLLENLRQHSPETRFVQISTDEVYGSLGPEGEFFETSPLQPSSPYSSSKAAAELVSLAYATTYKLDVVITRSSNNYGPYQFPEKLIPVVILAAQDDQTVPVYGQGLNVRDWLHVEDNCRGIWQVALKGRASEAYNIGGGQELPNLQLVQMILDIMKAPHSLIKMVADRPGHDFRYSINCEKIRSELNWSPAVELHKGLEETIHWYFQNEQWAQKMIQKRETKT